MAYNGVRPVVNIVKITYLTGVKLTKKAMDALEKRFEQLPGLEKRFVLIRPPSPLIFGGIIFLVSLSTDRPLDFNHADTL